MAAPIVNSAEELFQLTGSWEAAAALRDAQNNALNQYNWSQQAAPVAAPAAPTGGLLSGNILAGASWNSLNPTLAGELTTATGQATSNYAVGGATTADTLAQLNTYLDGGGKFDPTATVFLQTGGVDFLQGVDKATIKDNINQICKTLGDQGVNVVLTGSPYAKSINDVVTNNFDPKVDPLFNEIAKENKNVALVGVQGEILQNKKLLVDALHTNAEGTSIYNQAVINSLSQFENEVPSSTPQAIAQVQKTNTVATTPPVITQAAASPVVAQSLARAIPTARGTVIEGDDIEAQIAGVPQVVYETRVDPNNTANWETFNPKTGEVIDRGTFAGGGDRGLLAAAAPVIGLAASTVGLPFITSLLGGATGLTGSALSGATGATISGATNAIAGGSAEDIVKAALLGGAGAYGGSAISDYLKYQDVPIDFTNMNQDQINDALDVNFRNSLARAGLTDAQIKSFTANPASVYDAAQAVTAPTTTPVAVSTPVTDAGAVTVTAPSNVSLNNVLSTIGSTLPTTTITAPRTQVDQATLDLVSSQLASNLGTPANLANVTVTGDRPATSQEIVNAITATLPNVTNTQAQNIAQQVITSNRPVTTQDVITAISATLPALTTSTTTSALPTQTITAPKSVSTQDVVNAIIATTPVTTIPTTTVTAQRPTTIGDTLATLPATLVSTPATTTTTTQKETDPIKVAQLALTAAGLLGAGNALSNTGTPTGFDIVPIPASFGNPPAPSVAPFTPLPAINFGDRNLLIGTQWEKFLDPNYGKVPEPVQYSQPSNLSYNDLMGILGSRQGMPPASSLSINDIISGIQNQYGQTPTRTMG
jgi:hypothetical protein